jgi:hypothetical protein
MGVPFSLTQRVPSARNRVRPESSTLEDELLELDSSELESFELKLLELEIVELLDEESFLLDELPHADTKNKLALSSATKSKDAGRTA